METKSIVTLISYALWLAVVVMAILNGGHAYPALNATAVASVVATVASYFIKSGK